MESILSPHYQSTMKGKDQFYTYLQWGQTQVNSTNLVSEHTQLFLWKYSTLICTLTKTYLQLDIMMMIMIPGCHAQL